MRTLQTYTQAFKDEAIEQIRHYNYPVREVSDRLGIPVNTLYGWLAKAAPTAKKEANIADLQAENARLKRQLKRAEQERSILKEAATFFAVESSNVTDL